MDFCEIARRWEPECRDALETVQIGGGAMLPSELLMFLALCFENRIELVVESGRKNGFSTEMLCSVGDWRVESVETHVIAEADARLASRYDERLTLRHGNGKLLVPTLIDTKKRTAVLLDGPKSTGANLLYPKIRDSIVFCGIHDVPLLGSEGGGDSRRASIANGVLYFTDDEKYLAAFGHYDRVWMDGSGYKSHGDFIKARCVLGIFPGGLWDVDR